MYHLLITPVVFGPILQCVSRYTATHLVISFLKNNLIYCSQIISVLVVLAR